MTFEVIILLFLPKQKHSLSDLKRLYWQAGVLNKPTVFIFSDNQVVEEVFLEDINNILSSGEIPSLYNDEEFDEVQIHGV